MKQQKKEHNDWSSKFYRWIDTPQGQLTIKLSWVLLVFFLLVLPIISNVSADTTIPRIEPYVNDFAGLLTPAEELQLNQLADRIEANTTFEIAIVTLQSTGGQNRLDYANMIGDQNGVGKKDADNGIVVLWSVESETGGAIATGRGSESFITDATTGRIGRASRQYFDEGKYAEGFNYIVTELDKVIVAHQTVPVNNNSTGSLLNDGEPLPPWFWIVLLIGSAFIFIPIIRSVSEFSSDDSDSEDDKGYYRKQVYKRHGRWYNPEAERSYLTAAAAAAALATMNTDSDSDDDSDSSSGSGSSGGFGSGSFGGGGSSF